MLFVILCTYAFISVLHCQVRWSEELQGTLNVHVFWFLMNTGEGANAGIRDGSRCRFTGKIYPPCLHQTSWVGLICTYTLQNLPPLWNLCQGLHTLDEKLLTTVPYDRSTFKYLFSCLHLTFRFSSCYWWQKYHS